MAARTDFSTSGSRPSPKNSPGTPMRRPRTPPSTEYAGTGRDEEVWSCGSCPAIACPGGGLAAFGAEDVLQRDRHAVERPEPLPPPRRRARRRPRLALRHPQKRVQLPVERADAREAGLEQLLGRHFPSSQRIGDL